MMTRCAKAAVLALIFVGCVAPTVACADELVGWPQFLGPNRDGRYTGPPIASDWEGEVPTEAWRLPVGQGFAGPVVVDDRVFIFHRVDDLEVIDALSASSGEQSTTARIRANFEYSG